MIDELPEADRRYFRLQDRIDAAMTADSPSGRGGRKYHYYRCTGAQRNGHASCPTKSISADKIEKLQEEIE